MRFERRLEQEFEHPKYGRWAYRMTWDTIRGVYRPTSHSLRSLDDPPKVASTDPRLVRAVEAFARDLMYRQTRELASKFEAIEAFAQDRKIEGHELLREEAFRFEEQLARLEVAGSPEQLRRIASVYRNEQRAAKEAGRRAKPRERIREEMGQSLAWASKWIGRARSTVDPATGEPFLEPPEGREG